MSALWPALLDIDIAVLEQLVQEEFQGKERLIRPQYRGAALRGSATCANTWSPCPLKVRPAPTRWATASMSRATPAGRGLARSMAGPTVCAWYPITPSLDLPGRGLHRPIARNYRVDPATGKGALRHRSGRG